ncbi:MAG TPA: SpoVG family protein [Candidatus Goldiibacteriota bacterium]|nr:SpoVG family protein [Candidatus Goldiibacteriota bacterium]
MQITEVKVFPRGAGETDDQKLKAYASITFDGAFVVRGLKIIDGKNGLFVVMPSRKLSDGSFKDIAHPLNNDMRRLIEQKVLEQFRKDSPGAETRAQ